MADPKHLEILRQGVREWNKWRRRHTEIIPDLSRARGGEDDLEGDLNILVNAVLNQVAPGRAPTEHDGLGALT